jgi:uncharacterized protein YjaZ
MSIYIYIAIAFAAGFLIAFIIMLAANLKLKKELKSCSGLLESEKLIKETMHKENAYLLQAADAGLIKTSEKLKSAEQLIRLMDNDILLMQKSNEETEALLQAGEPVIYDLKMKLIEANNSIARYRSQLGIK